MPPRPRLLCATPNLAEEALAHLAGVVEVDQLPAGKSLRDAIPGYDALWANFDVKVDAEVLRHADKLRVIATSTTGTDHLDKPTCAARGIRILCIARDLGLLNTFSATAELGWMLLIACRRKFRAANRAAHDGRWHERTVGDQLLGATLGVLGLGRLGKMTARYGAAFGMDVLGCDHLPIELPGVRRVTFDELLAESDAICIHIHMTPENRGLFNAAAFARMKPGAVLVNTSRGDLIDEAALLAALESGRVGAFGADVLHDEWRADMAEQPIVRYAMTHDNVILTPHIGGSTRQTIASAQVFTARKLAHFLATGEELTMP